MNKSLSSAPHFRLLFVLTLSAAALLYVGLNPEYKTGVMNDDALYVLAAQQIWRSPATPASPLLQGRPDFPFPGLPLLLAPLVKLVAPHWTLTEWGSIMATLLAVFLLGQWVKRWLTPGETLLALALYAFNPLIAKYSGIVTPAPYFAVAIIGSFILLTDLLSGSAAPWTVWALGALVGWGSLMRPEAVLLAVVILAGLMAERRWRELALVLILPALCGILFALHWRHAAPAQTEYGGDLLALAQHWAQHPAALLQFSGKMLKVLFMNTVVAQNVAETPFTICVSVWISVFFLILLAAGWRGVWRERRLPHGVLIGIALFDLLYFAVHVFWHIAIGRYCIELLPLLLPFLWRGMNRVLAGTKHRKFWMGALAAALLVSYGTRNARALHESLWEPNPLYAPPWHALDWLNHQTPPSVRVLSTIAPSVTLYTQRAALNLIRANNEEDFLYITGHTLHLDYILDRPVRALFTDTDTSEDPNKLWDRVRTWIRLHPARYPVVFHDAREKVTIYRIAPAPEFFTAYAQYLVAVNDLQRGREDLAARGLRESLVVYPALGSAQYVLGVMNYLERRNLDAAEAAFQQAVRQMPDNVAVRLSLASLYHLQGKRDKSLASLREGLVQSGVNGERAEFIQNAMMLAEHGELELPGDFPPPAN